MAVLMGFKGDILVQKGLRGSIMQKIFF